MDQPGVHPAHVASRGPHQHPVAFGALGNYGRPRMQHGQHRVIPRRALPQVDAIAHDAPGVLLCLRPLGRVERLGGDAFGTGREEDGGAERLGVELPFRFGQLLGGLLDRPRLPGSAPAAPARSALPRQPWRPRRRPGSWLRIGPIPCPRWSAPPRPAPLAAARSRPRSPGSAPAPPGGRPPSRRRPDPRRSRPAAARPRASCRRRARALPSDQQGEQEGSASENPISADAHGGLSAPDVVA